MEERKDKEMALVEWLVEVLKSRAARVGEKLEEVKKKNLEEALTKISRIWPGGLSIESNGLHGYVHVQIGFDEVRAKDILNREIDLEVGLKILLDNYKSGGEVTII